MTRGFVSFFGVIVFLSSFAFSGETRLHESQKSSSKAIWIIDDFEDGDLVGWAVPTGACTMSNDTIGANGTLRSIKIDGSCGHFGGSWYDIGGTPITHLSYWVRSGDQFSNDGYLLLDDDNPSDLEYILVLALASNGLFTVNNGIDEYILGPYSENTWYFVSIEIDWVGKTFNVSIDGETLGWNLSFENLFMEGVDRLHVYNYSPGPGWWDEIYASTPPVSTGIMSDGFESADDTGWDLSNPALPLRLVLYSAGGITGAIGGRLGADRLCGNAAQGKAGLPLHARTTAFISVNSEDEIRDLPFSGIPTDRITTGPGTEKIADDWADLLDGSIDQSLSAAGLQTASTFWYSGSNANGSVTATTCSGWTDGSSSLGGTYGRTIDANIGWISTGEATCGLSTYSILCLAWRQ